eukprot:GHUV01049954.1.p2 GENE.GHUV01049954.1~~GHUV01049954.1.p2  ORF type:complete len:158 (+),score=32.75 GHUV01049954.1:555-1028(+)
MVTPRLQKTHVQIGTPSPSSSSRAAVHSRTYYCWWMPDYHLMAWDDVLCGLLALNQDLAGVTWLTSRGVPVTLVFTKIDKHKTKLPSPAQNILDFTAALEAQGGPLAIPPHFATSSTAQIGREPLLKYLAQRRAQHAQQEEQAAMVASQAKQTVAVP